MNILMTLSVIAGAALVALITSMAADLRYTVRQLKTHSERTKQ